MAAFSTPSALRRLRPTTIMAGFVACVAALALVLIASSPARAAVYEGVNLHSVANENYADMERELDAAQRVGANVVRVDINWGALEQARGRYTRWYLDRIDRFMLAARDRGIKVLATVHRTPCWASSAPDSVKLDCSSGWQARGVPSYPPTNATTYAAICKFIAARYRSVLVGIEVWNEPNRPGFLTAEDPAKAYVPLVKAAFPAIRGVAPRVKVVAGAISGANDLFLRQLYANGMKRYYDALSVHPYVIDPAYGPDVDWGAKYARYTFAPGLKLIRATQALVGDTKPIWATEFGWHTGSARKIGPLSGVDEQTQAEYVSRAFELLADPAAGLDFVEGALSYNLRDNGTDPTKAAHNYGLLRRDFSEKPSYEAVRAAISESRP